MATKKKVKNKIKSYLENINLKQLSYYDEPIFLPNKLISYISSENPHITIALKSIIDSKEVELDILIELLAAIGEIGSKKADNGDCDDILLLASRSSSAKIRYGAVLGLKNLEDKRMLPLLEDMKKKENTKFVKDNIRGAIKLLNNL